MMVHLPITEHDASLRPLSLDLTMLPQTAAEDKVTALDNDHSTNMICRVCRSEGTIEDPLFHPCKCSGSIKWVHEGWFV